MPELVFYDQRLPLKRKWSDGAAFPHALPTLPHHHQHQQLPRLPSLSAWANISPPKSPPLPSIQTMTLSSSSPPPHPSKSTASPESEPESVEAPSAKRATPMRNTSRERMKAEQAALRAQAVTLETELTCLRQLRHERLAASLGASSSSSSASSEGLLGWQEMAQRHWDQRIVAERENKRLREAVNGLATEVKGLEALFNSRSSALMASLKQNAQLAVQIQDMLAQQPASDAASKSFAASLRRPGRSSTGAHKDKKVSKKLSSQQQSPRDVACAMEAPQSPYGL